MHFLTIRLLTIRLLSMGLSICLLTSCAKEEPAKCKDEVANGYCLVWQDEFNEQELDASKWSFEKNCTGGGNNEAQCYVDNTKNVWVEGGNLHIKAIREDLRGPSMVDDQSNYDPSDQSGSGTYSSGRIRTKGKGDWRYGRFEIRAKLPSGQGSWPAIWMLPSHWVYGGWASSGEIDIMEAVNLNVGGERRVHGTLHFGDDYPNNVYSGEAYLLPGQANPANDFHVYAIEWEKGEIRWYVDDEHYATQTQSGWYSNAALNKPSAPFDEHFHLILNVAVGGDWAGMVNDTGIDESAFPQQMLVDYVRVYECKLDPSEGKGCGTFGNSATQNPGVKPPVITDIDDTQALMIFDGAIAAPFEWHTWAAVGDITYAIVDVGGDYGKVAQITYNSTDSIGYFQSVATSNLSQFSKVEFDLRVIDDSRVNLTDPSLVFRADCVYPCTSGNYSIPYPELNQWTHYTIPLSSLIAQGLDAGTVNTPFVIGPKSAEGTGLILQIDNVVVAR